MRVTPESCCRAGVRMMVNREYVDREERECKVRPRLVAAQNDAKQDGNSSGQCGRETEITARVVGLPAPVRAPRVARLATYVRVLIGPSVYHSRGWDIESAGDTMTVRFQPSPEPGRPGRDPFEGMTVQSSGRGQRGGKAVGIVGCWVGGVASVQPSAEHHCRPCTAMGRGANQDPQSSHALGSPLRIARQQWTTLVAQGPGRLGH